MASQRRTVVHRDGTAVASSSPVTLGAGHATTTDRDVSVCDGESLARWEHDNYYRTSTSTGQASKK